MSTNERPTSGPPPPSFSAPRRKWLMPVLLVVALACSFVAGAAVSTVVILHGKKGRPFAPDEMPRIITERLRAELGLSNEQAAKIKDILSEERKELQAIRQESWDKIRPLIDQKAKEIEQVLTPEQAARWKELLEKYQRDWMIHPGPGGKGLPHPPKGEHGHRVPDAAEPSPPEPL